MSQCRVKLLPDDPATEDLFGPHERVAQAIAKLVRREDGKKAIALEGTWGSGKSTTVQLLREELEERTEGRDTPRATVFSFDAWAHRGDPLRRSFIEELADHLISIGWICPDDWKEDLDELRERRETLEITSSPRLKGVGKVMVILLLLMPIGLVQLSADAPLLDLQFVWRLLAFGPALFGLGVWLIWRILDGGDDEDQPSELESDVLALFLNKVRTVQESTKLRTPDPTSIEFRHFFTQLLSDALDEPSRRLVIAIDNLDRVEADEALTIWSTMRTFFEFGDDLQREWLNRFWLLVPYDKDSLRKLWQTELEGDAKSGGEGDNSHTAGRSSVRRDAAEAFIDKSFQVRFCVSTPVLSDWRRFFDTHFRKAFPEHKSDEERYLIAQMYRRSRQDGKRSITPRDIILFLNQVGALHRQWEHDEISLEEQAAFCAFREEIEHRGSLVSAGFIPPEYRRTLDRGKLGEKMAALEYGVKRDKALQVVMGEPVEKALTEGHVDEIDEFRGAPGLPDVVFDTVRRNAGEWAKATPDALAHTANLLVKLENELPPAIQASLWGTIQQELLNVEKWDSFYTKSAQGIVRTLEKTSGSEQSELRNHLFEVVEASCPVPGEESEERYIEDWIGGVAVLLENLTTSSDTDEERPTMQVSGGAAHFLNVIRIVRRMKTSPDVRRQFRPGVSNDDIQGELERRVKEGEVDNELYRDVRFLSNMKLGLDWEPLGSTVANTLRANSNINATSIGPLVILLEELSRLGSVPGNHMSQQMEGGHIFHRLHQANQSGDVFAKAACVHSLLIHNTNASRSGNPGNAATGQNVYTQIRDNPESNEEVVEKVGDLLLDFEYAGRLLEDSALVEHAPELSDALLQQVLKKPDALEQLGISDLASVAFPRIQSAFPNEEDRYRVWKRFAQEGELFARLQEISVESTTAELHLEAYEATEGIKGSHEYGDYLRRRLGALPKETWIQQLTDEGPLLTLLRKLVGQEIEVEMPVDFSEALETHFRKVVQGKTKPSQNVQWEELLNVLHPSHRDILIGNLVRILTIEEAGTKHSGLRMYQGELLRHEEALVGRADNVLTELVPDLIEEGHQAGLQWLRRLLAEKLEVFDQASDSARDTLSDKMRREATRLDSESAAYGTVVKVAEELGIEISPMEGGEGSQGEEDSEQPEA